MKTNHATTRSHLRLAALLTTLALAAATEIIACDCAKNTALPPVATAVSASDTPVSQSRKFPLKGVVTDLLPDRSALMVKHEAIPGVMKAMTMLFVVDASVLSSVKKGDAITALMSRRDDDWRLDDVKVVPATTPST